MVMAGNSTLDVIDKVLPMAIGKTCAASCCPVVRARLLRQDSTATRCDGCQQYAQTVCCCSSCCTSQPADVRRRTLHEALRVVKPGGRAVIVDYAPPRWWHPLRWLWLPILHQLGPYARGLWSDTAASMAAVVGSRRDRDPHCVVRRAVHQLVTIIR